MAKTDREKSIDFDEIEYLKRFDPLSSVLWLQVILCHPNNTLYTSRIEFLLGLVLSLPRKEFGKLEMNHDSIKYLFDVTDENYSEVFSPVEDFYGSDQRRLTPFFMDRKKYYFFYSNYERPYEQLRQLKETYFFIDDVYDYCIDEFRREITESLEFQTKLLLEMILIEENNVEDEKLYIPSENYFRSLKPHFFLHEFSIKPTASHEIGSFNGKNIQEILNRSVEMRLFTNLHIEINNLMINIAPQLHLSILIDKGRKITVSNSSLAKKIHDNFKLRLSKVCEGFFTSSNVIGLLQENSETNILTDRIDFATIVDHNKLFLFTAVEYSQSEDISLPLTNAILKLNSVKEEILSSNTVGVHERRNNHIFGVYSKALEIWLIPVYESLCLNVKASIKKEIMMDNVSIFNIMDLRPIYDNIEKGFDFLKFIKEEESLKSRLKSSYMGEFMDRFLFYIQNGKSYMRTGATFDFGVFEPHMWSSHIFEEYWEKYQDNVHEEIENKFPGFFNDVEEYKTGIYRMAETINFAASYLVKWENRFIWVYLPPSGRQLEYMELHMAGDLLAPLISEYTKQFEIQLGSVLLENRIDSEFEYSIVIFPKSLIYKTPQFATLRGLAYTINEDNPIVFETKEIRYKQVRTFAIFDYTALPKLFSLPQNIGERYTMKALVKSIVEFYGNDNSNAEQYSEDFISTNMPIGIKGYSVEMLNVPHTDIDKYPSPESLNETDLSVVHRILSEFLIRENIKPGDYKDKDAKGINYKIYTFLQTFLEGEISKYNSEFIIYAYRQLELSEGHKFLRKLTLGTKSKGRTDYDIVEATKEAENKDSHLSLCIKHIIHTVLKKDNTGEKFVTAEGWTRLTAIADSIITAAMVYDYIHYDLQDRILKITDDYLIVDIPGEEAIDSEKLQLNNTEIKIGIAKRAHSRALEEPKKHKISDNKRTEIHSELDNAFKADLNFTYEDLVFVLHSLSVMPLFTDGRFPVTIRHIEELSIEINKIDTKGILESTVESILNFLCLYSGIYKQVDLLYPSDMMRNKERMNVSPFIKLEGRSFLYGNEVIKNALNFWSQLSSGDFPYDNKNLPNIKNAVVKIHREEDLKLEKLVEEIAVKTLGDGNVEARISNFKRLSDDFKKNEDCGEIDLLCINRDLKTVFVIDAKNINKKISLYHVKQSIREFFEGNKSYYSKLIRKKEFVTKNIDKILTHFGVSKSVDWKVTEAFISEETYFAGYYNEIRVDFILVENFENYLLNKT